MSSSILETFDRSPLEMINAFRNSHSNNGTLVTPFLSNLLKKWSFPFVHPLSRIHLSTPLPLVTLFYVFIII